MKKLLALALIAGITLSGCSNKQASTPTPSPTIEPTTEPSQDTNPSEGIVGTVESVLSDYDLPKFMNVSTAELTDIYGVSAEDVEEIAIFKPMMNVHATEIIVISAKDGSIDTVKGALSAYMTQQESNWSQYLPDQYELVQNRVEKEVGNTIIVVVAEEAEAIASAIEAAIQ